MQAFGVTSGLALAPQVTAPPPFGVFHDLRWLMVYHSGYGTFAGLLAALYALRVTLLVVLVRLAWPRNRPRPTLRRTFATTVGFVTVALVFLTPSAAALFTSGVTELWPFYMVAFVLALPVVLGFWYLAFPGWWRRLPPRRPFAWIALEGVVLTVASLAIVQASAWVTLAPVALTGVFNALAWYAIAHAAAHHLLRAEEREEPVALRWPALGAFVALLTTALGFGLAIWRTTPDIPRPPGRPTAQPVIDASGFRSSFHGHSRDPFGAGFVYRRYSYRGLGRDGEPLPYGPLQTYQSLDVSARRLAAQVQALHAQTGRKVDLVGVSEGTMVEKLYLLTHPRAPVAKLLMTSPIIRPGRVRYPSDGSDGWGIVTRFALAREASFISAVGVPASVDMPLLASMVRDAPLLRHGMLCPLRHVRQAAFIPLVDAIAEPPRVESGIPFTVLPTVHGSVGSARRDTLWLELTGGAIPHFTAWQIATDITRGAAAAWQMPTLPLHLGWPQARDDVTCAARAEG